MLCYKITFVFSVHYLETSFLGEKHYLSLEDQKFMFTVEDYTTQANSMSHVNYCDSGQNFMEPNGCPGIKSSLL